MLSALRVLFGLSALVLLANVHGAQAADKPEAEFEVVGYSADLNAIFARKFTSPDDGKCISYILDLEKKIKFALPAQPEHKPAVIAMGEDDETSSCHLRSAFDAQMEIKLKDEKDLSPEEKTSLGAFWKSDWSKTLSGYKTATLPSLGAFLRKQRSSWSPEKAVKLYELAVTEAEDGGVLEAFDAMLISSEWKPGYSSKQGKVMAQKLAQEGSKGIGQAKAVSIDKAVATTDKAAATDKAAVMDKAIAKAQLQLEIALRLDPKNTKAQLGLAGFSSLNERFDRAANLVQQALKSDAVLTTRSFREDASFQNLRCAPRAEKARATLPAELVKELKCSI